MGYPGQRKHFGSKQPARGDQQAQLRKLICGCRSLDALPEIAALANMYRMDAKIVEYEIGCERRRRAEVAV